ncbi:arginine-ornithine antiporter [Mobilicoccus caccae]|uniref:Arginine-ornithine antiporter n=1 Tax=Mobilicoccus caccae TaxID=1859295 RepID=A0ABQ6INS4_9MICO|nr:arginine-ornithine antiporter [Mobilicoccus caccae]GMA39096.1 arginine-ornithine antiporter [Mobilicoccus caccae]
MSTTADPRVSGGGTASNGADGGRSAGLPLFALIALVVGSMIGGGIFNLPRQMASAAAPGPLLIGWLITGVGMLMLAFIFQTLAERKPDVDGGVYGYARAGFGPFIGSSCAWGYWISAWIGNVGYLVLLVSGIGYFMPDVFVQDNTLTMAGLALGSVVLWATTMLCVVGVREAVIVNTIVTIAKVLPILMFLVLTALAFRMDLFSADIWGTMTQVPDGEGGMMGLGDTMQQVKGMMLVTVWVFIGIEGASIFSQRAGKRSDVGKATVIGFVMVLALLILVNFLAYGVMRQAELSGVADPALGSILGEVVGPWGAALIALGLTVSVLGAFLSWTLLCAEILRLPAQQKVLPAFLGKDNRRGSPAAALLLTGAVTQIVLIWAKTQPSAYDSLIMLASSLILLPYLWATLYQLKLGVTGESYETSARSKGRDLLVAGVGTVYALWLVYAAGLEYLLLAAIFYVVGTALYIWARREARLRVFTPAELVVLAVVVVGAVFGIMGLLDGSISV